MKAPRLAVLVLAASAAACAGWRWSGAKAPDGRGPAVRGAAVEESRHPAPPAVLPDEELIVSTYPARPLPAPVPPTPEERAKSALYYSDMGPDAIDVSAYPAQIRYDYQVYARVCSSCHSLARSVNAPLVSRGWWEFYVLGMRMRSRRAGRPLDKDDVRAVLDFLEYDARVRKVQRARDFDALTDELKSRFDRSIDERLRRMQQQNPHLVPSPAP